MFSTKLSAPAALDLLEYSPQLQQVPFYASWQTSQVMMVITIATIQCSINNLVTLNWSIPVIFF